MWPGKLTPWLKTVCFPGTAGGILTKLELRQVVHGSPDSLVECWNFGEDTPKVGVEDLANDITGRAQSDCEEAFDGPTQYTVLAFVDGNDFHTSRAPTVRFASAARNEGNGFDESEPANPKGFAAQQMRHNEGLVRMLVANTTATQRHMENLLERAYGRIEHLEDGRYDMIKMAESMLNDRSARELAESRERDKMVRYDEAWQSARVLLPTVVNKLAGKVVIPEATSPTDEILQRIIGSLRPEQLAKIQSVLDPAQFAGFLELANAATAKHEAEQAALKEKKEKKSESMTAAAAGAGASQGGTAGALIAAGIAALGSGSANGSGNGAH